MPRPTRDSRKSNSPPAASVALVSATVLTRSNSSSRSTGARSSGTAASATCIPFWPARSTHRTVGGPPGTGRRVRVSPPVAASRGRRTARGRRARPVPPLLAGGPPPPHRRRPAGNGPQGPVEPVARRLEAAHHAPEPAPQLIAPLGQLGPAPPGG